MTKITESKVEEMAIEILEAHGYKYLSFEEQENEHLSISSGKSLNFIKYSKENQTYFALDRE